jgi:hypothetical protein
MKTRRIYTDGCDEEEEGKPAKLTVPPAGNLLAPHDCIAWPPLHATATTKPRSRSKSFTRREKEAKRIQKLLKLDARCDVEDEGHDGTLKLSVALKSESCTRKGKDKAVGIS